MAEAAKVSGISLRRMRAYLLRQDALHGGTLLQREGGAKLPRYRITRGALHQLGLIDPNETVTRVEALEKRVDELAALLDVAVNRIGMLSRTVAAMNAREKGFR